MIAALLANLLALRTWGKKKQDHTIYSEASLGAQRPCMPIFFAKGVDTINNAANLVSKSVAHKVFQQQGAEGCHWNI